MNGETIIELADVKVGHEAAPGRVLVRDVQWRIGRGEFWVLAGGAASGKTSLLLTAAGLNRPAEGALRVFGRDLAAVTEAEQLAWRQRIGFVFDNGGRLFSHLSVIENVALPLQYHHPQVGADARDRAAELLAQADLEEYAAFRPSRLSLRIQQRVALVRALAVATDALFLDNPLGPVSARDARWWVEFLRQLQADRAAGNEPLAVVVGGDDFRGWTEVAGHFALIENERFRVIGGRAELLASREPVLREYVESVV